MPRVSAIVICLNEERKIGRCLASLAWVDELVVVDGGSTDRTEAVARAHGATVHANRWPGYAAQKTFALSRATGEWVMARNRARFAGDGYASLEMELWDPEAGLVAYGTQVMLFSFPR